MSQDARTTMATWFAAMAMIACAFAGIGCKQSAASAPLPLAVVVTEVVQRDVPIYSEWVGTTVGFVNAQVMPRVQGYLLEQRYKDGDCVKANEPLFVIDERPYKTALDQALGNLAEQRANLRSGMDAHPFADRRHRRARTRAGRRSRDAVHCAHHRLADRSDEGGLPDHRARVPPGRRQDQ